MLPAPLLPLLMGKHSNFTLQKPPALKEANRKGRVRANPCFSSTVPNKRGAHDNSALQLLLQEFHTARNAGRERWGHHTLQKKTVLLTPAHRLPPSPKHRPACPQCIFTQLLICSPRRTKAAGHSLPSKLLAQTLHLLCPVLTTLTPAVLSRDPTQNLSPSGSSLASTSCSHIQRNKPLCLPSPVPPRHPRGSRRL